MIVLLNKGFDSIVGGRLSHRYHQAVLAKGDSYDMQGLRIKYLGGTVFKVNDQLTLQDGSSEAYRLSHSMGYAQNIMEALAFTGSEAWTYTVSFSSAQTLHLEGFYIVSV